MQCLKNQEFSAPSIPKCKESLINSFIILSLALVTIFINSLTSVDTFSFPIFLSTIILLVSVLCFYCYQKKYLIKYFRISMGVFLRKKLFFKFLVFSTILLAGLLLVARPRRIEDIDILQLLPLAIQEEIIFRFLIPCALCYFFRNKLFLPWSFFISSIVFSLFHLPDTASGAVYYFYTGILFSITTYKASFIWAIILHVQINISLTFFYFDYNRVSNLLIYITITLLASCAIYGRTLEKRYIFFTQNRNASIDCLRAFALVLVVIDNLTLYSWGEENYFAYDIIQVFGNFGYFIFLCLLGYSANISITSSNSQSIRSYDINLLKLGIMNILFFFSFDILVQLAIISMALRKVSFWRSSKGLAVSLVSLSLLILLSPLSIKSDYALMQFPSNLIMDPLNFYADGFINLVASLITLPQYIGIPGILIYILPRIGDKKYNYPISIIILFFVFILLGVCTVFMPITSSYIYIFEIIRTYVLLHLVITLIIFCVKNKYVFSKFTYISKIGSSTLSGYILSGLIISLGQIFFLSNAHQFYLVAFFCLTGIIVSPLLRSLNFSFEEIRRGTLR